MIYIPHESSLRGVYKGENRCCLGCCEDEVEEKEETRGHAIDKMER